MRLEETVIPAAAGLEAELVLINAQSLTKSADCSGIARALRLLIVGVLGWQALAGAVALGRSVGAGIADGYGARLSLTTDERLQRALGDDFAIVRALRECAVDGEWALCRVVPPKAMTPGGVSRAALLTCVRNALYPRPYLMRGVPDPVALAESGLRQGQSVLLLALAGDPAPDGRRGWSSLRRESGFEIWRFQKV